MDRFKSRSFNDRPTDRFAEDLRNASFFRQRLVDEIQDTLTEIENDLSFLQTNRPSQETRPKVKRRVYRVIPRIKPKQPKYIGRYHYGPEAAELDISNGNYHYVEESSNLKEFSVDHSEQIRSAEKYLRTVPNMIKHRVQIFAQQFVEENRFITNETIEPLAFERLQITEYRIDADFPGDQVLKIDDLPSKLETARMLPPPTDIIPDKPLKHRFTPGKTSQVPVETLETRENYFFSDFTDNDDDVVLIDPHNFNSFDENEQNVHTEKTFSLNLSDRRTNSNKSNKKQIETKNDGKSIMSRRRKNNILGFFSLIV